MTRSATILLVEDDKSMLFGMSDLLQVVNIDYDIQILTAGNGQEALAHMAVRTPDLIVSDIMMPLMDGFQFLSEVQKRSEWLNIPFIFLTARGEKHEVHKGRLSGAALYITKPFHSFELLELIKSQLDRKFQLEQTREQHINNLKKDVLQILNHEFRTPLTYVTAYYEMLAESVDAYAGTDNFQEYLRGIQAGCNRLTRLIESFIAVIELRSGEAQRNFERDAQPIRDVAALAQEAVLIYQPRADKQGVNLEYTAVPDLPPIWGDRRSLLLVWQHLLDNAIKFSAARLTEKPGATVTVQVTVQGNEVAVSIQDEGVGLPTHMQDRVFDLFVQYNREQLEQQGAGAGLTIAKGLVELHNGRIELTSQENVGSTFTVYLPVYHDRPIVASPGKSASQKNATVLIVEDDRFLLEGLEELLSIHIGPYQLTTYTATNGQEGLQRLINHTPDLIISDIMMPIMDGYAFLREVRKNPDWVQIPVIFLTAKGERSDIHKGLRSGVEEYITKPYDSDELLGLVAKQLDRHFQLKRAMSRSFDELKRSIIEFITPDFRVPLASVAKYSSELENKIGEARTDDDLKNSLQGIQASSIRLSRLIENFISLAELKTGEAEMAFDLRVATLTDVGFMFYEVAQLFSDTAVQKGLSINCPLHTDLPAVQGDRITLMDSMRRLLEIGLSYHKPYHAKKSILMNVVTAGEELYFSVEFPFPLSSAEATALNFQLNQDDPGSLAMVKYAPELSIVKGYVALHNGRLRTTRQADSFTFTIILPTLQETDFQSLTY